MIQPAPVTSALLSQSVCLFNWWFFVSWMMFLIFSQGFGWPSGLFPWEVCRIPLAQSSVWLPPGGAVACRSAAHLPERPSAFFKACADAHDRVAMNIESQTDFHNCQCLRPAAEAPDIFWRVFVQLRYGEAMTQDEKFWSGGRREGIAIYAIKK